MERHPRPRADVETFALGLVGAAPLAPYLLSLGRHPIARFALDGDYAGLELATRYVFSGRTLLGPYSRFGFNHPGPLYFDLVAPIYALAGSTSNGLYLGACAVNIAAAITVSAGARIFASPPQAIAIVVVLAAWLAAFGTACVLPWNPLVVVLALLAFLTLAAQVARGRSGAIPFAAAFGLLVAETHLSTVPTVAGVSIAAAVAYGVAARRRGGLQRKDRRALFIAACVTVFAVVPMIAEQLSSREGNLTKIVRFFATVKETPKPLHVALTHWIDATSWLPARLLDRTLLHERAPQTMASDPVSETLSPFAARAAAIWLAAVVASALLARRRRDELSLALLATGTLASIIAVLALRDVVGDTMYYLVFWTTAGSTVAWMGVATTVAQALSDGVTRLGRRTRRALRVACMVCVGCVVALATSLNQAWASRDDWQPQPLRAETEVYTTLLARLQKTGETPVIHVQAAWNVGLFLLNELTRDGIEPRVAPEDRWILGRQLPSPRGATRLLHIYSRTVAQDLPFAACLDPLAKSDGLELLATSATVTSCPARSAPTLPPAPP